jgi:hypothetical protein
MKYDAASETLTLSPRGLRGLVAMTLAWGLIRFALALGLGPMLAWLIGATFERQGRRRSAEFARRMGRPAERS